MGLGDGTAIGLGISLACLHLMTSSAEEKIIILLTDGENNAGKVMPIEASKLAAELEIRVNTIGIGKDGESLIEYIDPITSQLIKAKYTLFIWPAKNAIKLMTIPRQQIYL